VSVSAFLLKVRRSAKRDAINMLDDADVLHMDIIKTGIGY